MIPSQKGLFEMNPGVRRGLEGRRPRDAGCWAHRTICCAQDKRDPVAVPLPWLRAPGGSCGAAPSCGRDRRYRPDRPLSRVLHLHRACMDHPLEVARQRLQADGKPHPTAPSHPQAAKEAYELRKQLVEPVFGIIKEQQGARRFPLRRLVNVAAEWTMLATAFNLRTLWRVWRSSPFIGLFNGPEPRPVS